jgi:two-component system sensor histidine kinase KdpD
VSDDRPDPDALLRRVQAEEQEARRGKLKIFFGASAGVGKTYAMLAAARATQAQGTPLVVGVVETHGRADTEAMAGNLPRLPLKEINYRERALREFDLDAALAHGREHPQALVLLDELAHSNVPGSRHPKRWQDAEELLAAGIDVWTTLNVQHLESLNDVVGGITGVRVQETVPDRVFDQADEVVVVDLPPDELLQRLRQGKVYIAPQAERAAGNFFRKGNLLALRELALRRTADRVDDEMKVYRREHVYGRSTVPVWPTRDALLACIGPGDAGEKVVRACARLAAQLEVPWHAVHVETPRLAAAPEAQRARTLHVLQLAQQLGAQVATLPATQVAATLVKYAREHNLSRLALGRRLRSWRWSTRSLTDALTALGPDLDVLQVAAPPAAGAPVAPALPAAPVPGAWRGYALAAATCLAATALAAPLAETLELTNIVMLFLLAVVGVALRHGRGPAVLAAFLGVGLFDFFFVPPRFSFAVSDVQYVLTFAVMLTVALVIGQMTAGLKYQASVAIEREGRVRALYQLSRDLSGALLPEQVAEFSARFLAGEFGARSALLPADAADRLTVPLPAGDLPGDIDTGVAQWCFDHARPAGRGTDTLPASALLYLPLSAPMRTRGVLAVQTDAAALSPELRRLLDTCASLVAISLERLHYVEVAQQTTLQMESERLRNSLLSAISHDLRTPLAALVGSAESLPLTPPPLAPAHAQVATAMRDAAMRMNTLVNNLLDMARLEAGAVTLNRQWQPLEEVIGSARHACAVLLAERPVRVSLPEDLPLVQIDAVLIERVFVNLLENAAKYTPAGSAIEIAAQATGEHVVVTVDDHGAGLPRGREEALFDKFERGRKENATPGVGLGLAICRAIVNAHGGSIHGETRLAAAGPAGARFTLRLPRGEPPQVEQEGASAFEPHRQENAA